MTEPRIGFHASAWGVEHLLAALHGVAQCGFEGIEIYADLSQAYVEKPEEFRDILEITGVPIAGIHSGGQLTDAAAHTEELAQWRLLLDWARTVGAEYAVYYGGSETSDQETDTKRAADLLHDIGKAASERGVGFCYEPDKTCPFNSRAAITGLMAETDPTLLSLSADTARLQQMGFDPTLFLLSQRERLGVVHLRDISPRRLASSASDEYCDPGAGSLDLVSVADTLRAIRYGGWIVGVVDSPDESPLASCQATAEYFRGTLDFAI